MEDEAVAKPKRRTRKTVDAEEDAAQKRKRKTPVKRASKPRIRTKVVEEEDEETEDDSYADETNESSDAYETESSSQADNDWEEAESEVESAPPARQNRPISLNAPIPAVQAKKPATPSSQERPAQPVRSSQPQSANDDESDSDDDESEDGDTSYRVDDGLTADQLRGLSKRQKRELRQKFKDQQRNQKR